MILSRGSVESLGLGTVLEQVGEGIRIVTGGTMFFCEQMKRRRVDRLNMTYAVAALRAAVARRVAAGAVAPQPGRSGQQPWLILTFSVMLLGGKMFFC